MDVTDLFDAMKRKKNFTCGRGATDEEVGKIETELGILLPNDYVIFLKNFGYVSWFGDVIYGIDNVYDAVSITLRARAEKIPDSFHPFPNQAVVIRIYDGGGYFVLYSEDCGGGVGWLDNDELNGEVEHWDTFEEYLRERVEIEDEDDEDDEANSFAF